MANIIVWTFSERLLDKVSGKDQQDTDYKKRMLRENFIGKELHKCCVMQPNGDRQYVYRIGHTNRIITEQEFKTFVNNGLLVSRVKEQTILQRTSARIAHQIVGNTGDIPISTPDMQIAAPAPEKPAAFVATEQPKKSKLSRRHATTPVSAELPFAPARSAVPAMAELPKQTTTDMGNASYILQQTGMMQAINDTQFFETSERPSFKPFAPEEPEKTGVFGRLKGAFGHGRK